MPRRVDHELRRRQITDAVCRLTVRGGLASASFREVAAEAGVSVRLVQYYFGTKLQLLLATQTHVSDRVTRLIVDRVAEAGPDPAPRDHLRALLGTFIPTDDESHELMLMLVVLYATALVDGSLAPDDARVLPQLLHEAIANQLRRGKLRAGVDVELEAAVLAGQVPSLSQAVLGGAITAEEAFGVLDYALGRALR